MIRFFWMDPRHDAGSVERRYDHRSSRLLRPSVTTRLSPKRKPHRKCFRNFLNDTPHQVSSWHSSCSSLFASARATSENNQFSLQNSSSALA